jgi:hypothetical protein
MPDEHRSTEPPPGRPKTEPDDGVSVSGIDLLKTFIEHENVRLREECDALVKAVKAPPVSPQTLERLSHLNGNDFREVIRAHPGYDIDRPIQSLRTMLKVFRDSYADLQADIRRFDESSRPRARRDRTRRADQGLIADSVRKNVFAVSAAAAALVAHGRRAKKLVGEEEFTVECARAFDQAQHKFITELRNELSHVFFHEVGWKVTYSAGLSDSTFEFSTGQLLREGKFTATARSYIQRSGEKIRIPELFADYAARVEAFYDWLNRRIEAQLPPELADYRRCARAQKVWSGRVWYRVWLDNLVRRGADPYEHLGNYIGLERLEEINRLPKRSAEQVNRIIEMVDRDGICDAELRELVFKLFGVSPSIL